MKSKTMLSQFRQNFSRIIDSSKLAQYDQWAMLIEKSANLILTFIGILLAITSLYFGSPITVPLLLTVSLAILGFAVSSFIGIGYRYYIANDCVYGRIQLVLLALVVALFGAPLTTILSIWMWSLYEFSDVQLAIIVIGLVLSTIVFVKLSRKTDALIKDFAFRKIDSLLVEPIRPFNKVFHYILTCDMLRVRLLATGITMLFTLGIWIALFPGSIEFLFFMIYFFTMWWMMKRENLLEHLVSYNTYQKPMDLVQFCVSTSYGLSKLGIRRYEVVYNWKSFDKSYVSLFSTIIQINHQDSILVLHSEFSSVSVDKIQRYLKEKWSEESKLLRGGPFFNPFAQFDGKYLIDRSVWQAEKLLWTGTDLRIAITLDGIELREANLESGDFCDFSLFQM